MPKRSAAAKAATVPSYAVRVAAAMDNRTTPPSRNGVTLTDAQWAATKAVREWHKTRSQPFFYLAGFAGTGKSTLLPFILDELKLLNVCHAAYTGKAASVMRRKGAPDASTIHRLCYNSTEFWADGTLKFKFTLNKKSALVGADLLVLDECSMVDEKMAADLMSFGVPILVLGDPGQLPPIGGEGFFTRNAPDAFLKEVHRQALGNPIVAASMAVRENPRVNLAQFDDKNLFRVFAARDTTADLFAHADQILVGRHRTRRNINAKMRRHHGFPDVLPLQAGAKLVCIRNKHELGLMNGVVYETAAQGTRPDAAKLGAEWEQGRTSLLAGRYKELDKLQRGDGDLFGRWFETTIADEDGKRLDVRIHVAAFEEDERGAPADARRQELDHRMSGPLSLVQATWGYALTVHKAQGSQWDEVLMTLDPVGAGDEEVGRWIYTGLTRAAERFVLIR